MCLSNRSGNRQAQTGPTPGAIYALAPRPGFIHAEETLLQVLTCTEKPIDRPETPVIGFNLCFLALGSR